MSEVDTRRQVALGTNFLENEQDMKGGKQGPHGGSKMQEFSGSGGGFAMSAAEEQKLLEDFKQIDPSKKASSSSSNNANKDAKSSTRYTSGPSASSSSAPSASIPATTTPEGAAVGVRFNSFRPDMSVNSEREDKINDFIAERQTWRASVPVLRWNEYWRLRADFYPYIKQSEAQENFFLRGITCHPRLSEFPTCKEVIRDYFTCRDQAGPVFSAFNSCAPMKEQLSACINMVFVRNHERGDKKLNEKREETFTKGRESKFNKLQQNAEAVIKERGGFRD